MTHSGEIEAAPQVTSVSEVAWEWEAPEDYVLRDVLAGVGGAVMVLGDGVIGLERATGEELWHYRSPDGSLASTSVTPGGKMVVLAYRGENEGDLDVVVLDAATGELRGEYPARTSGSDGGWASHLTENARLSYSANERFGLVAESLETGEPLWEFEGEIPEEAVEFSSGEVSIIGDTIVMSAVFVDGVSENVEPGHELDQVVSVVGLDSETGTPLWEKEFSYTFNEVEQPQHTLSGEENILLLEVGSAVSGPREQWLLNPATGEELAGTAFSESEDRYRVALLGNGYVEKAQDQEQTQYWVMDFDGSEREHIEVASRPGERSIHPGVVTDEGVLRLDYLTDGELARGEVEAEFLSWESGEATMVPVDLSPNESLLINTGGSINADADAPRLVPVPGSFVVTEEYEMSVRAVGLS